MVVEMAHETMSQPDIRSQNVDFLSKLSNGPSQPMNTFLEKLRKKPSECRYKLAYGHALTAPGDAKLAFYKTIKFLLAKCNYSEIVSGECSNHIEKF